jgi:hypothetical protein
MTFKINRINLNELENIRYKLKSDSRTIEQSCSKELNLESKVTVEESESLLDLKEFLKLLTKLQKSEFIEIEFDIEEKP